MSCLRSLRGAEMNLRAFRRQDQATVESRRSRNKSDHHGVTVEPFGNNRAMRVFATWALGGACAFVAAPANASAQDVGVGSIRVHPNLATDSRDRFIVCTGTVANRALYGWKTTGTTGIVAFPVPAGTAVVTTVNKVGFGGREKSWIAPAAGATSEVIIYMFAGTGGPLCPGVNVLTEAAPPPAPPPPPSPTAANITVDPGPTSGRGGFYVCVGTSQNRAQYGNGVTQATGPLSFANLPSSGMIKATVMRAGYAGVERDWYPTPGQTVVLSIPISPGSGGALVCPGYVAPSARQIRAVAAQVAQQVEVGRLVPVLPAVQVLDQYNNPMGGVTVAFKVTQGGGFASPASVVTGSDGVARVSDWYLGPNPGTNALSATMAGVSPIQFTATAIVVPATFALLTATSQQALAGSAVPELPGVRVLDRNGNPVAGATVAFVPSASGGSVSPATVVTGPDGVARIVRWTLGPVGTYTVMATAGPVRAIFTATALASAPVTATVSVVERALNPTGRPARLGEETLGAGGTFGVNGPTKKLDCTLFGPSYVMVGIKGKGSTYIEEVSVGCAAIRAGGSLSGPVIWTTRWEPESHSGTAFERKCPSGRAVSAIQGTAHPERNQLRTLTLHCKSLAVTGLTTGIENILAPTGVPASSPWGPERCSAGRPASALRVIADFEGYGGLFNPRMIVGAQLVCEQPLVP